MLLFTAHSWGQTWNLSPTMTATLSNGILTVVTTKSGGEAMPDMVRPWYPSNSRNITAIVI